MTEENQPAVSGPLPPVILLAAIAVMIALHFVLPLVRILSGTWNVVCGALVIALGVALNLWADNLFKKVGAPIKPFAASTALVERGPYTFTRNPMYLGMVLVLAGAALALGTLSPWLVLPVFAWWVSRRFIAPEERELETAFGVRYQEYKAKVRRWL